MINEKNIKQQPLLLLHDKRGRFDPSRREMIVATTRTALRNGSTNFVALLQLQTELQPKTVAMLQEMEVTFGADSRDKLEPLALLTRRKRDSLKYKLINSLNEKI
jgi:hypothetical protein